MFNKNIKCVIDECLEKFSINQPQLAALLNVTERKLINLHHVSIHSTTQDPIFERLRKFRKITALMTMCGIPSNLVLNYMNESIPGEQGRSILYFIVDEPSTHVETKAFKLIDDYHRSIL